MRNHEVTESQPLLKKDGSLTEPGWSRSLVQIYDRTKIKAPKFRIKEWDYYLILNQDFAAAFTLSDDGYIGLESASILDFTRPWEHTETILKPFTMGRMHLPSSSVEGSTSYHDKKMHMRFEVQNGKRRIRCKWPRFFEGKEFSCDIILEETQRDSMVIATPWKEKKTAFYYNQKINCMRAKGRMRLGDRDFYFSPDTDFGTLDWGRGVWTYDNKWYWGSGNGIVGGKPFGFNIGYGFGDTGAASENILFYNGTGHKLDDVTFHIPSDSYMRTWTFTSSDGRFEMEFEPVIDRAAKMDVLLVGTDQHQVFGKMKGRAVLDDGSALEIKDFMCFAEYVHNRY